MIAQDSLDDSTKGRHIAPLSEFKSLRPSKLHPQKLKQFVDGISATLFGMKKGVEARILKVVLCCYVGFFPWEMCFLFFFLFCICISNI